MHHGVRKEKPDWRHPVKIKKHANLCFLLSRRKVCFRIIPLLFATPKWRDYYPTKRNVFVKRRQFYTILDFCQHLMPDSNFWYPKTNQSTPNMGYLSHLLLRSEPRIYFRQALISISVYRSETEAISIVFKNQDQSCVTQVCYMAFSQRAMSSKQPHTNQHIWIHSSNWSKIKWTFEKSNFFQFLILTNKFEIIEQHR